MLWFKKKEKPIEGFHPEDVEIWNCPDCNKKQENCPWRGSILDLTHVVSQPDKNIPFHKRWPINSNAQKCDYHRKKFG